MEMWYDDGRLVAFRYGVVGARVYQYLLTTGYKSETIRVAERCMIDREECQMLLHRLHSEHIIKISEVGDEVSVTAPRNYWTAGAEECDSPVVESAGKYHLVLALLPGPADHENGDDGIGRSSGVEHESSIPA